VRALILLAPLALLQAVAQTPEASPSDTLRLKLSLEYCVNQFSPAEVESTRVGFQYWFVGKEFLDGRTIKMSVVRPHEATHPPHVHGEDEFFFVLEGEAELILGEERVTVGPYTSFYCPPSVSHGIRNVGESELKYLVIKKYPSPPADSQ